MGLLASAAPSLGIVLVIYLVLYIIVAIPLGGIFQKAGQPFWAGFIPIYSFYVLLKIIGRPAWWMAFIVLAFIPLIGSIALLVVGIIVAIDVSKSFGHGGAFAVGLVLLSFIFYYILWLGPSTYRGPAALAGGGGTFGGLFGDAFGGGRAGGPTQGADVSVSAQVDLSEAAHGSSVKVGYEAIVLCERCHGNGAEPGTPIETCPQCDGTGQIRSVARTPFGQVMRTAVCDRCGGDGKVPQTPCGRCDGRGRRVDHVSVSVEVPLGIADGQRIRVASRGHAGERGGPPGDLYVLIRVREDSRFVRDGDNLVTAVDISAPLAALGTTVEVPTLDDPVELEIPAGTQPHETLIVRGKGMPSLRGRRHGDLRVVVNVIIPRRLGHQQRELYEELAGSLTEENLRSDEGVFAKLRRAFGG